MTQKNSSGLLFNLDQGMDINLDFNGKYGY